MIKITVLNDNRKINDKFQCEHGLSLFIEVKDTKLLLDAGQTSIYKDNSHKLGINLDEINYIVLSHGDYDHGNGLKYFNKKVDLICHPNIINYRKSNRTNNFSGLDLSFDELSEKFNVIQTSEPYWITKEIVFLGEIPRTNNFEGKNFPMTDEKGNPYQHLDDSGIAIKTENGLVVISGCAHSGICNTIEYAKKITDEENILLVMGGFHLSEADDKTLKTIEYLIENNVQNIMLAHCTSDIVCEEFIKLIPEKTKIIKTGLTYEISDENIIVK